MKRCCTCKEEKELDNFGNNKGNRDGKDYMCKSCKSEKAKIYRNSSKGKKSKKEWRTSNKDKVNAQKRVKWANRTPEQIEREKSRKRHPEYLIKERGRRSTEKYKCMARHSKSKPEYRLKQQEYKRNLREKYVLDLMNLMSCRGVDESNPHILYHFKINEVFKFGIAKYGVDCRYVQEGLDLSKIQNCTEYIMSERNARDCEKIIKTMSKDYLYLGESPFPRTGVTEIRTESMEWLIDMILEEINIEYVKNK